MAHPGPSLLPALRRAELTGKGPRGLLDLPASLCTRIDEELAESTRIERREPMPALLVDLGTRMRRRDDPLSLAFRGLIVTISRRVQESEQQQT